MIATGIPRFNCHISLYRLGIDTADNFLDIRNDGIKPFTLSNRHEMCSFETFSSRECLMWSCFVYIRLPLWRHRACIATYSPKEVALTWSWWYRYNWRLFCLKITCFNCYDLNDDGRMEIDYVFASGSLVGRTTTHEWVACRSARSRATPLPDPHKKWLIPTKIYITESSQVLQKTRTIPFYRYKADHHCKIVGLASKSDLER